MNQPLVSVVIACYNAGRYLPETLNSALAQTYPSCEIIVVDDGSTDDTVSRMQPYLERIHFLRIAHGGLAAARNAGLRIASGDYIALLDADDLWLPEKLSVQVAIARKNSASGMIVCDGEEFGSKLSRSYLISGSAADAMRRSGTGEFTRQFHREFIRHFNIRCPAQTLLPRSVVSEIGPFANFDAQDYDYYLRVSARFPVTFHAHSLVRCRDREDSMSGPAVLRDLNWSRKKLRVLRTYARVCQAPYRMHLENQITWNRAEVMFHYGELFNRPRALRGLLSLLRRKLWPPVALPFLAAHAAPRWARMAHKTWRERP
jgi:glycosyltransferase involved in cell wall biosynthesis